VLHARTYNQQKSANQYFFGFLQHINLALSWRPAWDAAFHGAPKSQTKNRIVSRVRA
jgi:hypothetical protein